MRMSTLTRLSALRARVYHSAGLAAAIVLAGWGVGGGGGTSSVDAGGPVPVVPAPATGTWSSVKRGGEGAGRVFHPTSSNVLYARTDIGGAYRWDPTTMGWTLIADGAGPGAAASRFRGIESAALDPNDDQPVYIATGKHTFEAYGHIYVSSDRCRTWTHVDLPFPPGGNSPGRAMGERPLAAPHLPSPLFHGARTAGL